MTFTIAYVTKCDNVTRYYQCESYEKALSAMKELNRYKNLFKKVRIVK